MATREVGVRYTLELNQFIEQARSIPNITDKQLDKMVRSFTRRQNQVTRELAKASKLAEQQARTAAQAAEEAAKITQQRWLAAEKVLQGVGGQFGELGGRVRNFSEGLGGVAGPAGIAAAALVGMGLATSRAASALKNFVDTAVDSLDELEEMGQAAVLPPEAIERLRDWESAARAMQAVAREAHVEIASFLAVSFTNLADAILGAKSALDQISDGLGDQVQDVLQETARRTDGVSIALGGLGLKGQALALVYRLLRDRGREYREELEAQQRELEGIAVYGPVYDPQAVSAHRARVAAQALAEAQRRVAEATRIQAEGERLLGDLRADNLTAEDRAIDAAERRAAQIDALASAGLNEAQVERLRAENTKQLLEDLAEVERRRAEEAAQRDAEAMARAEEMAARRQALSAQVAAQEAAAQEQIRQVNIAAAMSIISSIDQVAGAHAQSRQDMTHAEKQAALEAWHVQQAAALAQAVVLGALAVQQAIASAPPPMNIIPAIAAATASGVQIAQIATAKPPEFPTGGIVRASDLGLSADHGLVGMQPDEGVVSRRGMGVIGEDGLNAINRGEPPGIRVEIVNQYRHRPFDRMVTDNLRRPGPLANAIHGTEPLGHA